MLRAPRIWLVSLLTLTALLGSGGAASANWVTIKNDTGKPIVLQETVVVNGEVKRGKATNLLAGETHREFLSGPAVKRLDVFEAQNPKQAVWSGSLNCKDENQGFAVTCAGGKVTVNPVAAPPRK